MRPAKPFKHEIKGHGLGPAQQSVVMHRQALTFGWEVEPRTQSEQWGFRVAVPVKDFGHYARLTIEKMVSEAVVDRYTDWRRRYDTDMAALDAHSIKRWYPVRLVEKPFNGIVGGRDPFQDMVDEFYERCAHFKYEPVVTKDQVLSLHWTIEVVH